MNFDIEYYRNYIRSWIKLKGLTQEQFAKKYPDAVKSYEMLIGFLNGVRNPNLVNFYKLLSPMGLTDEQKFYLSLVKIENELDPARPEEAELKQFYATQRQKLVPFLKGDLKNSHKALRDESILFNEVMDLLDEDERRKVIKLVARELQKKIALLTDGRQGKRLLNKLLKTMV